MAAAAHPLDRLRRVPCGGEPGPAVGAVLRLSQDRHHRVVACGRLGYSVPDDHPAVPGRKRTGHRPMDRTVEPHPRHGGVSHLGSQLRRHRRPRLDQRQRAGGNDGTGARHSFVRQSSGRQSCRAHQW